ncbi:MAG TPA: hypothetical protein PKD53_30165 [Chloroflexaceae bacterium]|nr:hypothetical protein [Chloroflexaceae bacterium]
MSIIIDEQLARLRHQEHLREARRHDIVREALQLERAREAEARGRGEPTALGPLALLALWFVGLNALAGAAALLLAPRHAGAMFFWAIEPPLNAALLGALYLGGGIAVCLLARRGRWEPARALTPVLVSAGLLIAGVSLAHLDRFGPGLRPAYWLAVYLGAAPLALAVYAAQERLGASWEVREPVAPAARALAVGTGALLVGAGAALIIWPAPAVAAWPWPITPLTLRVFAAWFAAFGVGLLWFLADGDWGRLAILPRMLIGAAALALAALIVHHSDLTTTGPGLWLYVAHLVALAAAGALLHWLQRGPRRAPRGYRPARGPAAR